MLVLYVRSVCCKKFNISLLSALLLTLVSVLFFVPVWKDISKANNLMCAFDVVLRMLRVRSSRIKTPTTFTNTFLMHALCICDEMHFLCPPILFFKNKWVGWTYVFQFDTLKCSVLLQFAMWTSLRRACVRSFGYTLHHAWKRNWVNRRHKRFNTWKLKTAALPLFCRR